jgi:hypothetical protein
MKKDFVDADSQVVEIGDWLIGSWPKGHMFIGRVKSFTDETIRIEVYNYESNPKNHIVIPRDYSHKFMRLKTVLDHYPVNW